MYSGPKSGCADACGTASALMIASAVTTWPRRVSTVDLRPRTAPIVCTYTEGIRTIQTITTIALCKHYLVVIDAGGAVMGT